MVREADPEGEDGFLQLLGEEGFSEASSGLGGDGDGTGEMQGEYRGRVSWGESESSVLTD